MSSKNMECNIVGQRMPTGFRAEDVKAQGSEFRALAATISKP